MKILFVSYNEIEEIVTGGSQCSERNYCFLKNIGEVDFIRIGKRSNFQSIISIISMNFPPLTNQKIQQIITQIEKEKYDMVYLDSSLMGKLAFEIKKMSPELKVVVFFHNVEIDYVDVRIKNRMKKAIYKLLANRNERLSIKYADKMIALHQRDKNRIYDIYNRQIDFLLPITFSDTYKKTECEMLTNNKRKKIGLFVGALGNANYDSLKWFLQNSNVLKQFELQVVGKNFENVKSELDKYPFTLIGSVDDIAPYYKQADFVISPIQYGGGMKVKIAEALMYGKTVLGTNEALEGYDDETGKALICCNTINEFDKEIIKIIQNDTGRYNLYSRKLFEDKYSNEAYYAKFKEFIDTIWVK